MAAQAAKPSLDEAKPEIAESSACQGGRELERCLEPGDEDAPQGERKGQGCVHQA